MGYEQSVLRRATARLEAQRKAREEAQERLRSEIYAKLPRVAAIDRELRRTITQIIAASLRDGSDPVPAIGVIRDKNLSLQAEKAALLTEHGYPADALDDKPACPKCSDTGWVGANMCACLKALCTEEQIRELSKLLDLGEQSFDSFSLDYYSPLPWPGESLSPRENMEFIFDVCSSYARKFGRFYFRNLFLTGAPGLGKTFLSACIARVVSEDGFSVVYDTAGHVFSQFESAKFRRDDDGDTAGEDVERCMNCDPPLPGLRSADPGRLGQRAVHPLRPVRPLYPHQYPPDGGQADGDLLQPDHGSGARPLYPPDRLPPGGRVPRAPLLWGGYPAVEKTDAIKSGRGVSTLLCLIIASEATYFVLKDLAKIMAPVIPSTSAIARYICNRSNSSGT